MSDGGPPTDGESGLTRGIRPYHAVAMVVGTIIGASIFVQPSDITGMVPAVGPIFLVWGIAGILTLCGALVCAELASIFPKSGGVYVFLRETFGRPIGFLWGWAMFWTMHSGIIAAIATVFARYTARIVPLSPTGVRIVAVLVIVLLSIINLLGVRQGSRLQALFTAGKLLAVALIIVLGFALGGGLTDSALQGGVSSGAAIPLQNYLLALVAGLFAFGGWHMVTYSAGETVDATRTIPRALIIGTLLVTVCYIALNAVYLYLLPIETVASSQRIAADAAERILGPSAGVGVSALVMFSTFGAVSGIILAGPRVYYAMARDGLIFDWIGQVHPTFKTPARAIVLQGIWSAVLAATGTYSVLFTRVVYTEWIFFGLMAVGLMMLRRKAGVTRGYSVPWYPVVPIVFSLSAFAIAVNQILTDPAESALGLGMVVVGLPVYYLWTRNRNGEKNIA